MKYSYLLIPLLIFASCDSPKEEDKSLFINEHLGNSRINLLYADTADFRTKNVYAVHHYTLVTEGETWGNTKEFHNQTFGLSSYTKYLPGGRIHYKEQSKTPEGEVSSTSYYYSDDWKRLMLEKRIVSDETYYYWLSYDADSILNEEFSYQLDDQNNFSYSQYKTYSADSVADGVMVKVVDYGLDTLALPMEMYTFSHPYLTIVSSEDTASYVKRELKDRKYRMKEVFDKNDNKRVEFSYTSEGDMDFVATYLDNQLHSKLEYYKADGYRESLERSYRGGQSYRGLKKVYAYDEHNNIIFHQMSSGETYYYITSYTYQYDYRGNWIERMKYFTQVVEGENGEREMVAHEIREIEYYQSDQQPEILTLPNYALQADKIKQQIPQIAQRKQDEIDAYKLAVENGTYDHVINIMEADLISDFTPKYWTDRQIAYGDLDGVEGDEAVVVYQTPITEDNGFSKSQCLAIFKKENDKWILWHQSFAPILGTGYGGIMDNPFAGISIENGAIVINHYGGSRSRWSYTHRYRFQDDDWYLIGATSGSGALGEGFMSLDFNLSTGIAICGYSEEEYNDDGESEEIVSWKEEVEVDAELPLMDDVSVGNINTITVNEVIFDY